MIEFEADGIDDERGILESRSVTRDDSLSCELGASDLEKVFERGAAVPRDYHFPGQTAQSESADTNSPRPK